MGYEPQITRYDEDGPTPMALIERAELDSLREALGGMLDLLALMQDAGTKYLAPDNDCGACWYVSRMLWLADGSKQRAAEGAARRALGLEPVSTKGNTP